MTMMAPPPSLTETRKNNNRSIHHQINEDPYVATLESLTRVAISGLGGFLAGLSIARRGGNRAAAGLYRSSSRASKGETMTSQSMSGANETKAQMLVAGGAKGGKNRLQRQRIIRTTPPSTGPYADQELPYTWAIAVTAFAGIIEFTRMTSPSTTIWNLVRRESNTGESMNCGSAKIDPVGNDDFVNEESFNTSIATISDFVIGGSIAGAFFKGSAVRTRVGARMDSSIMGLTKSPTTSSYARAMKGKPLSGLVPGAALGLLAGVATVAVDHAQEAVEEYFGHIDGNNDETFEDENEDSIPIPDDIKAMSNEELMKSIADLKRGQSESYSNEEAKAKGPTNAMHPTYLSSSRGENIEAGIVRNAEARDLISSLGFRPHPSG